MKTMISAAISSAALAIFLSSSAAWGQLSGTVAIDGSSTVYPITEAVAEEFSEEHRQVRVTVGISGTGGGFKRFALGQTDISNASRPIKAAEAQAAAEGDVEFIELPVAYDGLSVVVHPSNDWVDHLTIDELKTIFLAERAAETWSDVRAEWPDVPIKIFAPGTDSGTFDYFKEVIAGDGGSIRPDMSVSEDDNVLVRGVSGEEASIGFFGVAYYMENQDQLKIVPIVNPETGQPATPTPQAIESGAYAPFARPLFIYVNKRSSYRPEVKEFVDFYLAHPELVSAVGYVELPSTMQDRVKQNWKRRKTGTQFLDANGGKKTGPLPEIYH